MKTITLIGTLLFVIGLTGVIWGVVEMYDDRDSIDMGEDVHIVLDEGDFPPVGIAGAIAGGIGLILIVIGGVGGKKSS
jgi:hypothetical protein